MQMQIKLCMNEKKCKIIKNFQKYRKYIMAALFCVSMQISVYDTWECRGLNNAFD